MILRCFAAAPATTPPPGWNATIDGWIFVPPSSAITSTEPVPSA
jgi:hypothetical protein